jgi:cardiolipin synthase (CMP-forming)
VFIEEYLQDLRRDRYRPAAVARYVARAWQRGREEVARNPEAARSLLVLGLALFGLAFLGSVGVALAAGLTEARRILLWTGLWLIPLTGCLLLHVGLLRDRSGYALNSVNLPTAVTAARLAIVPAMALLLVAQHWKIAFWVVIGAMLSDVVDGWLARRLRQETQLGAVVDPVTDIFFHLTLFLSLWVSGQVAGWVAALAAIRYGGLLFGGAYLYVAHGPVRINSTLPGKISGFVMSVMVGFLLLGAAYGAGPLGRVLLPLARDAVGILLAGGVVHGAIMGWYNLRHAHAEAEAQRKVIRGVRFGDRQG